MKRTQRSEMVIVHMGPEELGHALRFVKLCDEKFGKRFQKNRDFRHQMFDALLAAVENIGK
ncbi:MAG TPA: hypothetical protein VKE29_02280 [Candidatus Udaeobacter sp.]|nr:hypothetical protein [Candidatus Udaeobacter sp.]